MGEEVNLAFLTSGMLKPITDALSDNLEVLLPIGIAVMGVLVGVSLVPRIVYKFL